MRAIFVLFYRLIETTKESEMLFKLPKKEGKMHMTSKERLFAAMDHKPVDRIPLLGLKNCRGYR